jgi:hypothetical protein
MQRALDPRLAGSEQRRNAARERILRAGFWCSPENRPLARVIALFPAVSNGGLQF